MPQKYYLYLEKLEKNYLRTHKTYATALTMILDVITPLSIPAPHLSYIYSGVAQIGARVVVPLGKTKRIVGVVVATREVGTVGEKLREIIALIDTVPLVNQQTIKLYRFISDYYLARAGDTLRSFVPRAILSEEFEPQSRLLKNRHKKTPPKYLPPPEATLELTKAVTLLQTANDTARGELLASLCGGTKGTTLILVPTHFEARKTADYIGQYAKTELYHPKISIKRRAEIFVNLSMLDSDQIIVGTRSAVGLPFRNLTRVIVLDEHAHAYKSGRTPRFSARDAALVLASLYNSQTLLVSQAPSVESYFNASTLDNWQLIDQSDAEPKKLRSIALEHGKDLISKYLQRRIAETLVLGKQVVIFQNRRGWSSMITCASCGYIPSCPSCNCSLTLHKADKMMICHSCGYREPEPQTCPKCHGQQMQAHGRGTERLEEQLAQAYPATAVLRLDSDNASRYDEITEQFATQKADIIVGTQLIINNLDFTNVALIAIANADNLLSASDFRASEQAYRLIYVLAEQARESGAELVVQTSSHNNPTIESALNHTPSVFYARELAQREDMHYPPFSRLVEIDIRSPDRGTALQAGQAIEQALRPMLGTALSPLFQPQIERQAGNHIVKLLIKIDRKKSLSTTKEMMAELTKPIVKRYARSVAIEFIVDPL